MLLVNLVRHIYSNTDVDYETSCFGLLVRIKGLQMLM